jgi:imidazole glycerol-phosphate synthase subunit HisF
MLRRRVIACLDVDGGRVVKGIGFRSLEDRGDPVELALRYEAEGVDEVVFLDIGASVEGRATMLRLVSRVAECLSIPLTLGGGIRTVEDIRAALRAGADKVSVNSAAVGRPGLLDEAAHRFGAQCVVASIDGSGVEGRWRVFTHGGRVDTGRDVKAWAEECAQRGAGEILLTSIDRDGSRAGYDLPLTRAVADTVAVPVVASGGAGGPADVCAVLDEGGADAALVAGILHEGVCSVYEIKEAMMAAGIAVRRTM